MKIMKKILTILSLSTALFAGGIFSVGQKNFGLSVGSSNGYGNDYVVVGVNANYFVTDNLSIGTGYAGWFGDKPRINEVSIPLTYYMQTQSSYKPYAGLIYRHTFIDKPYDDYDVYGGRIGVAVITGTNSFITIGWVQEHYDVGDDSDTRGYPEINAGFLF